MTRRFVFIGVSTGQSSIMRIFPHWRDRLELGADVEIAGIDLPLHAAPERYREVVAAIRGDSATVGGLVTTHKIDLFEAATDLFDEVDRYARLLREVSCIGKRGHRLLGWATDPISVNRTLQGLLDEGYFGETGAEILCFGAGGAAHAITLDLLSRPRSGDRPRRLIVTDISAGRLESLRALHTGIGSKVVLELVENGDPIRNDTLVAGLPPRSVVINATGMGKDRPGSPITDAVRFPECAIAWDLNYRGELDFLRQASEAPAEAQVRTEDGWTYFIWGWATVIERVFDRPISGGEMEALSRDADFARPAVVFTPGAKRR